MDPARDLGAVTVVLPALDKAAALPAAGYRSAFALLDHVDFVLGPALDGGYCLIAIDTAAAPPPAALFTGVPMGTYPVLSETARRVERLGLRVRLPPALPDLDRIEALQAALDQGELAGCPDSLETTGAVLAGRWQPA